mgnify:CR=1 FL=1
MFNRPEMIPSQRLIRQTILRKHAAHGGQFDTVQASNADGSIVTSGLARCRFRPCSPRSQPTPVAPGACMSFWYSGIHGGRWPGTSELMMAILSLTPKWKEEPRPAGPITPVA